jgi:hypothetical protein
VFTTPVVPSLAGHVDPFYGVSASERPPHCWPLLPTGRQALGLEATAYGLGGRSDLAPKLAGMADAELRSIVIVEGQSDGAAVRALARRQGYDLDAEGVSVVPWAATGTSAGFSSGTGPRGSVSVSPPSMTPRKSTTSGARSLEPASGQTSPAGDLEALGFYACHVNLEDELTRALGPAAMEELFEAQGELSAFRTYQKQPAHREEPIEAQLRGFLWNRKLKYGVLIIETLNLDSVPRPLAAVLAHVLAAEPKRGADTRTRTRD